MSARKPELDSTQRRYADEARELAEVPLENLAAAVMNADPGTLALTYGLAFGEARAHIRNLLAVIGELTSQPTAQDDAGRAIVADLGEPEQPEADERGARLGGELRRMGAIAADLDEEDGDGCPETSDGMHCGHYFDPADRSCCACGAVNWSIGEDGES